MKPLPYSRRTGHWLTPQEVGNMAGLTAQQIRHAIVDGRLAATCERSARGTPLRYWIARPDAEMYCGRLPCTTPITNQVAA